MTDMDRSIAPRADIDTVVPDERHVLAKSAACTALMMDKLPVVLQILRSTLATAGCRSIAELHQSSEVEMQSPTALHDSDIHDMVPMNIEHQIL